MAELQQRECPGGMEMLLLDSGAYTHVCPPSFAPHVAVTHQKPRVGGLTASGQGLITVGRKNVELEMWGGETMKVCFNRDERLSSSSVGR